MIPDVLVIIADRLRERITELQQAELLTYIREVVAEYDARRDIFLLAAIPYNVNGAVFSELETGAISSGLFGSEFANGTTRATVVEGVLAGSLSQTTQTINSVQRMGRALNQEVFNFVSDLEAGIQVGTQRYSRTRLQTGLLTATRDFSDQRIGLISELHTTRMAAFGGLSSLSAQGLTRYQWNSVLDGRECLICNGLHGMIFEVQAALDQISRAVNESNPEALAELQPWTNETIANVEYVNNTPPEQIQADGRSLPPAHGRCRCLVSRVQ